MMKQRSRASGVGLERLCGRDWLRSGEAGNGVEFLEAWFGGHAYQKHRHDTYAICLTTHGVQGFTYRGTTEISIPGQVVVLHPDEVHDGYAATAAGFGYRQLYVEPALIFDAMQALCGRPGTLPFLRKPVVMNQTLAAAIIGAFHGTREPLAIDSLILQLAEGLMEGDPTCRRGAASQRIDIAAVGRARAFLDAQHGRVVHSTELEAVTGLTRYELARQFRRMCGTSPYRYLLMRRIAYTREQLAQGHPLVEVAITAGFADQAHFSRVFKATVGMTPAAYCSLKQSAIEHRGVNA